MSGSVLALALLLNAAGATAAYLKKSLTADGAFAAFVVGLGIYVAGGLFGWLILMSFFVSSSALSILGSSAKERLARLHAKGSRRDAAQVGANGGIGLAGALLFALTGENAFLVGLGAAFASATADTWASELGVLSRAQPVSILTGKPVERGTSGGVTLPGLAASAAGSAAIAMLFGVLSLILPRFTGNVLKASALIALCGVAGALIDSVMGGSVQAQYRRQDSGEETEHARDNGVPNVLVRGVRWIDNDAVNATSGLLAAALAVVLYLAVG